MTVALINGLIRPLLEPRLPNWIEPFWFMSVDDAIRAAPHAEIVWADLYDQSDAMARIVTAATRIKWLNSIYAGAEWAPLDILRTRGAVFTNGAGINAVTIAEYVIMAMLVMAKGYADVVRAQDQRAWLADSPGKVELANSRALLFGAGAIGSQIKPRLTAMNMAVDVVRRTPRKADELGPDDWRSRLSGYDWIILALPATRATVAMIGAAEIASMKTGARIVNVARGALIDTDALVAALTARQIAGAWLDATDPEPLPSDHPLWTAPGAHVSMHLSGRAQDQMIPRSIHRFITNLEHWRRGEPVSPQVDLTAGY